MLSMECELHTPSRVIPSSARMYFRPVRFQSAAAAAAASGLSECYVCSKTLKQPLTTSTGIHLSSLHSEVGFFFFFPFLFSSL